MPLSAALRATAPRAIPAPQPAPAELPPLLAQLGAALAASGLPYCQWKGHHGGRWAEGRGDLDLLVERRAGAALEGLLGRLGFKLALPPKQREEAGLLHFYGFDERGGSLVHVHVHHDLVLGVPWRKHYRPPGAGRLIASAENHGPFRVPAPELDLALTVSRVLLMYSLRDALRWGDPPWLARRLKEIALLEEQAPFPALGRALRELLPEVEPARFAAWRAALNPGATALRRLLARRALASRLSPHVRRPPTTSRLRAAIRRLAGRLGMVGPARKHLASGGALVALVGPDGAGKSTGAHRLAEFFGAELAVRRAHLGRPPRSLFALASGGLLRASRALERLLGRRRDSALSAHLELLRYLATARDRYRLYRRERRAAAAGALVLCERYPVAQNRFLVGPSRAQAAATGARGRLAELLRRLEESYYERIAAPDAILVLRLDPEEAVRRKSEEPAAYVRLRARVMAATDWSHTSAVVIDAGRPADEVLADLKAAVWRAL